jgi:ATP-binding cassette subfamily B protein
MINKQLPRNLFPLIGHFLRPYKVVASIFICLAFFAGFWGPFNSILIKQLINLLPEVQNEDTSILIWPAALIVLNFIVFDNFTWRTIGYINYKFQATIKNQITNEVLNFVMDHSHNFFQNNLSGRIANQITTLSDNIELIVNKISPDFIRSISLLFTAFIAAYYVNPLFFYVLLIWFIVFSSFSISMSNRLVGLANTHAGSESTISGQLVDTITNNNNIRIFARKDYEISRMRPFFYAVQKAFRAKAFFIAVLYSIQGLMIAVMMGFSAYFLVHLYGKNQITIGDFALILGLSMELGHMLWYTMTRIDEFNQAIGKCKQSLSNLMIAQEIEDKPDAKKLLIHKGEIAFEGVKFHYKDTTPLFQDKSIVIEANQKVGLVGYSGSGKSTFVSLILRLYDVSGGRILIDQQNISEVIQDSLRASIAMIPQDPSLFHRSVMDNIRYGKAGATDEEVIMAAKKAHAHEFISLLPQGYESLVGERGIKLSGGQRQRISIARAILKNAPILILDEATSQLDSVTEGLIQESLWALMQRKTTLVVAHRLSTLLHMDRILVFDKGKIVEDGTHDELLKKKGLYKTLWNAQVGGFLPDKNEVEK